MFFEGHRLAALAATLLIACGDGSPHADSRRGDAHTRESSRRVFVYDSPSRDLFIKLDSLTLHALEWGPSDAPVMLIVPGLGNTAHTFHDFALRYMDRYRVVALTQRGHGQSDQPPSGYDTESLARDLAQVMDALAVDSAVLVGASIGTQVVGVFANRHPARVRALILLDEASDSYVDTLITEVLQAAYPNLSLPEAMTRLAPVDSTVQVQRTRRAEIDTIWVPLEGAGRWSVGAEADYHFGRRLGRRGVMEGVVDSVTAQFISGRRTPDHAAWTMPVLGIYAIGEPWPAHLAVRDTAVFERILRADRERAVKRFRENVRHGTLVVLEPGAHAIEKHRPDDVHRAINTFLDSLNLP